MLYLYPKRESFSYTVIVDINSTFNELSKDGWKFTDYDKRMIYDTANVTCSTFEVGGNINIGGLTITELPTHCKALMLLERLDDIVIPTHVLTSSCAEYIEELSRDKDIRLHWDFPITFTETQEVRLHDSAHDVYVGNISIQDALEYEREILPHNICVCVRSRKYYLYIPYPSKVMLILPDDNSTNMFIPKEIVNSKVDCSAVTVVDNALDLIEAIRVDSFHGIFVIPEHALEQMTENIWKTCMKCGDRCSFIILGNPYHSFMNVTLQDLYVVTEVASNDYEVVPLLETDNVELINQMSKYMRR